MARLLTLGWLCLWGAGCVFDPSGVAVPREQGVSRDAADLPAVGEIGLADHPPIDMRPGDGPRTEQPPCAGLSCTLGCNTAANRCNRVKPTGHDVATYHDKLTGQVNGSSADLIIDTSTGEIRAGAAYLRPGGGQGAVVNGIYWNVLAPGNGYSEVSVFGMAALDLPAGRTLTVVGERALSIYATGNVTIAGTMTAAAKGKDPGPGGRAGGESNSEQGAACFGGAGKGGGQSGVSNNEIEAGGGGGGHGATGGKGGDCANSSYSAAGGAGGNAVGGPTLWPLLGGCGGGAGGGPDEWPPSGAGGYGGGGGGALQIAAGGSITISGVVTVPGAGGEGGHYGAGGGGGGAGGSILLEATTVSLPGTAAANGGGGGSGGGSKSVANVPSGQDGQPTAQPAEGGITSTSYAGPGGPGGAGGAPAGGPGSNQANAGGGGGAAGRVRINALGASPTGVISPAPLTGPPATW